MNGISNSSSFSGANFSDYSDESDDDGYETVATPFTATSTERISLMQSPPSTSLPTDLICNDRQMEATSMSIVNSTNPFQQFAETSSLDSMQTDTQPINPPAFFAHEVNRLDSFRKQNRTVFAQTRVEELAYAGFNLNDEGTIVQCSWCKIELTEEKFQKLLNTRPGDPGSVLNDEPWNAMCVHRHENGQAIDPVISGCPWVRRNPQAALFNVMMVIHLIVTAVVVILS